jgi:Domain of unknown function (DUF4382)
MSRPFLVGLCVTVFTVVLMLVACGGGGNTNSQTAFVNVSTSDPPTCSAPSGPYSHVFVTVTDVKIHTSANAGSNDSGWLDLTPNLKNSPRQVDLLSQASTECFLVMLGSKTEVQAGSYQQIRIFLAPDNSSISSNQCSSAPGNPANCVVLAADNSVHGLKLASEAQNGLKIPSGQIAGGKFAIAPGETKDLDIDFNACASIVANGSGQFILKPVLHAGEVGQSSAINGTVIDNSTSKPIVGGTTVVALEQEESSGVDRVVMSTLADANGNFALCPVPAGTYDIVVAAVNGGGVFYAATVTTGVQASTAVGNIPANPEPGANGANTGSASLTGVVQTSGSSGAVSEIVTLSALQTVGISGSNLLVTVPLVQQSVATSNVTIASGASCSGGFDCIDFTLAVPGVNAFVGSFIGSGTLYVQSTGGSYIVDGQPVPLADGTPVCGQTDVMSNPVTVTPGNSFPAGTLPFTNCS